MKSIYRKLVARFDALNVRERWLVSVAVLGGIVLLGHSLFIAPAQTRAIGRQLNLRRRLVAGQGQFKQFAEGKHGRFLNRGCSLGRARDRLRPPDRPAPFPVAG